MSRTLKKSFQETLVCLYSEDPTVRLRAVLALGRSKRKETRKLLIKMLDDIDVRIRCAVILSLVTQENQEALPSLRSLLSDPNNCIRSTAVYALGELDISSGPVLLNLLNDSSAHVRSSACIALGKICYKPAALFLRRLINDPEPEVRASACWAVGKIGDNDSQELLLKSLDNRDLNVRFEAAYALMELGDQKAYLILKDMLASKESPDFIESEAFSNFIRGELKGQKKSDHKRINATDIAKALPTNKPTPTIPSAE